VELDCRNERNRPSTLGESMAAPDVELVSAIHLIMDGFLGAGQPEGSADDCSIARDDFRFALQDISYCVRESYRAKSSSA
jgi:hypothetical protein